MHRNHFIIPLLSAVLACGTPAVDTDSADFEAAPFASSQVGKLALASAALDNGPPWFGARVQAELSERAPLQAWTFELPQAASVTLATLGTSSGPDLDTVLYLYRFGPRGWGSYVARNDDHAGGVFSSISRTLQAGRYRVVIKARTPRTFGPFALSAACSGAGCQAPDQPATCAFGGKLTDAASLLRISTVITVAAADQLPDALARAQLVTSAGHVPGMRLGSAEQLFARADGGLVRWLRIWDDAGARDFRAYEYRIDARSFGAVFAANSGEPVARVSDGVLTDCRVPVARCLLGSSYRELLRDIRFEVLDSSVLGLSAAQALPDSAQAQLLQAVRVAYPDVEDIAAAFAAVDANQVHRQLLNEIATQRHMVVYEYGAGDNSFGSVFMEAGTTPIARIEDGAFTACDVLQ